MSLIVFAVFPVQTNGRGTGDGRDSFVWPHGLAGHYINRSRASRFFFPFLIGRMMLISLRNKKRREREDEAFVCHVLLFAVEAHVADGRSCGGSGSARVDSGHEMQRPH